MPTPETSLSDLFVESFNADLLALGSSARVAVPADSHLSGRLEIRDDEGNFIEFVPDTISPEMVAIAFRLYGRALNRGIRLGEDAAWAKLRHLIGAASTKQHHP